MTRAALCPRIVVVLVFTAFLVITTSHGSPADPQQGATPAAAVRQLMPKPGKWTVALGPGRERDGAYTIVPLPMVKFKEASPYGAALSLSSGTAAVFCVDSRFGNGTRTRVLLCDVHRGQVSQQWVVNGIFMPLDLDPAGRRLLVRHDQGGKSHKTTAEIWTVAADNSLTQQRWVPYADEPEKTRDLLWAGFVGAGRVVTLGAGGKLIVWDAATLKPLCWVSAHPTTPAVSPNGKYVAFLRPDSQVGLLDPEAGEVLGLLPLGVRVKDAALAFRPDGRALACVAEDRVVLLDTSTGQVQMGVVPGIQGRTAWGTSAVGWADERLLFVNDVLVDPAVPMPLWSYHNLYWKQVGGGHVWFVASGGKAEYALVPLKLPQPSIREKLASARAGVPPLLLKPGDPVQIDVSPLPKERQREARQVLEERLRHFEYRPAATAAVKLEARLGKEGERTTTYTSGNRKEDVATRVIKAEVRLLREEKELWSQKIELTGGLPFMISTKPGQSAASRVAGASIPDYALLKELKLPQYVQAPEKGGRTPKFIGTSYIKAEGVR